MHTLKLSLTLWLALTATTTFGADFRNTHWGMSLAEVMAQHSGQLPADRRHQRIAYDGQLGELPVRIYYQFSADDALVEGGYEVRTESLSPEAAIEQYLTLNALLRQKYPSSETPRQVWDKTVFKADPKQWGRAVRVGQLTYDWQHTASGTHIQHSLTGNRRSLAHHLSYTARDTAIQDDVLEQL